MDTRKQNQVEAKMDRLIKNLAGNIIAGILSRQEAEQIMTDTRIKLEMKK